MEVPACMRAAALLFVAMLAGLSDTASAQLNQFLRVKRYLELESALVKAINLPAATRAFYDGVLANRQNQLAESERLLAPLLNGPHGTLTAEEEKIGLRTLADDYLKMFRYGEASDTFSRLALKLDKAELKDIEEAQHTAALLRGAPAQTVTATRSFTVPTQTDAIGLVETTVHVAGSTQPWILDTGANFSVLTRSTAERLHLSLSSGTTPVYGTAGKASECHVALIPLLRLGLAEVHNVAVLVFEDKDLYIAPLKFQIQAILGYPVLAGLGRISFYANGRLAAAPSLDARAAEPSAARLFMENFTPLVAVGVGNDLRLFKLDTGAINSDLTVLYWQDHRNDFRGQKRGKLLTTGAGGTRSIRVYTAPKVVLKFGGTPVALQDIPVSTTGVKEYSYGRLGQDALKPFSAYTLDFGAMRFSVEGSQN